ATRTKLRPAEVPPRIQDTTERIADLNDGGKQPPKSDAVAEEAVPAKFVSCSIEVQYTLRPGGKRPSAFCYFDRDPSQKYTRLAVISGNASNRRWSCAWRSKMSALPDFLPLRH